VRYVAFTIENAQIVEQQLAARLVSSPRDILRGLVEVADRVFGAGQYRLKKSADMAGHYAVKIDGSGDAIVSAP
jgi:hypothetical protein